jgi:hypothetical protein
VKEKKKILGSWNEFKIQPEKILGSCHKVLLTEFKMKWIKLIHVTNAGPSLS